MTSVDEQAAARARMLERGHLPVLDSYRAIAATAVVATHVAFQTGISLTGGFGALMSRLDIGVALFFSLSGFLLYRPWATADLRGRQGPGWKSYLWRRALRILPAYWVVVAVALALLPENQGSRPSTWVANLLLIQIYVPGTLAPGLTQMWSLATEVAFYLVLPLLGVAVARVVRRLGSPLRVVGLVAVLLGAANVGWTVWVHSDPPAGLREFWLPSFLTWFAVGMLLAAVVAHVAEGGTLGRSLRLVLILADQPGACWSAAAGLMLVAATPVGGPYAFETLAAPAQSVAKNLLYAAIVGLVLLPATLGHQRGRFFSTLSNSWLRRLGDISYGIFLWHLLVLATVFAVTGRPLFSGGFWPVFVETLLASIAVAGISWVVLERPALRLKSRVSR